ncbi:unnamed protein product [Ectocarpus sp. CCAP 1310/34]|nr:unnamed protein product [Ectocarpus sp. CCAP 1310/34]
MDVYQHEGKPDDIPKGTKYLGCFADKPSDRALKLKFTTTSKMDYDASIIIDVSQFALRIAFGSVYRIGSALLVC